MAVKVIKSGQKEFYATCDMCGCEFTYELSDLKLSCALNKVACPTCGKEYYHKSPNSGGYGGGYLNWPQTGEPIPYINQNKDPCADCDWMKTLLKTGTYVGDTPCTWCPKNQFSCNISGGSISQSGSYPEAHLADTVSSVSSRSSFCNAGTVATIHLDGITVADQADRDYVNEKLQEVYNMSGCSALNKCGTCGDTEGKNSCHNNSKCNDNKNCRGKH